MSVAVALVGAAAVTASGWAVQAAALPPPTPAARIAADATVWFHEHRLVFDVFHLDHRRLKGACLRGWFPGSSRTTARASLLRIGSQPASRIAMRRQVLRAPGARGGLRNRILALVGCSGELSQVFGRAAQSGGRLTTERSYAANQPAVALELQRGEEARMTLYVSPATYRPLVAYADLEGTKATARLYLSRATPRSLRQYHLYQDKGRRRPRR